METAYCKNIEENFVVEFNAEPSTLVRLLEKNKPEE